MPGGNLKASQFAKTKVYMRIEGFTHVLRVYRGNVWPKRDEEKIDIQLKAFKQTSLCADVGTEGDA